MRKLKVGEKVKWQGNGGVEYGNIIGLCPAFANVTVADGGSCAIEYSSLYPTEGFYPMPGDTVVSESGYEREVIVVCGDVFFTTSGYIGADSLDRKACVEEGWTIKGQTPERVTMTTAEIEAKLGLKKGSLDVKS